MERREGMGEGGGGRRGRRAEGHTHTCTSVGPWVWSLVQCPVCMCPSLDLGSTKLARTSSLYIVHEAYIFLLELPIVYGLTIAFGVWDAHPTQEGRGGEGGEVQTCGCSSPRAWDLVPCHCPWPGHGCKRTSYPRKRSTGAWRAPQGPPAGPRGAPARQRLLDPAPVETRPPACETDQGRRRYGGTRACELVDLPFSDPPGAPGTPQGPPGPPVYPQKGQIYRGIGSPPGTPPTDPPGTPGDPPIPSDF